MTTPIQPDELARLITTETPDTLIGFDVDGVLAPIVAHADDARLSPGVAESIAALADKSPVAVVSGRALESLERLFAFPASVHVVGSHGAEVRGQDPPPLSPDERYRLEQINLLANKAAEAIGEGAWVETKVASSVLHTRTANQASVAEPLAALSRLAPMVDGVTIKPGSHAFEMMARNSDKGTALVDLSKRLGVTAGVFFGDDVTDEDAFAVLGPGAITVKVGEGPTHATHRLADPAAVAETLQLLSAT